MSSLLDRSDLDLQVKDETDIMRKDGNPSFRLGKAGQRVAETIGEITPGETIQYKTRNKWSTHQLLQYLLSVTGPADVYLSTYTASEDPMRVLVKHLHDGVIQKLHCVFDYRIKTYNAGAFQLIAANCRHIALVKNHAKVLVIQNQEWNLTAITSSNWNNNSRIEVGVIFTDRESADFHKGWITELTDGSDG